MINDQLFLYLLVKILSAQEIFIKIVFPGFQTAFAYFGDLNQRSENIWICLYVYTETFQVLLWTRAQSKSKHVSSTNLLDEKRPGWC